MQLNTVLLLLIWITKTNKFCSSSGGNLCNPPLPFILLPVSVQLSLFLALPIPSRCVVLLLTEVSRGLSWPDCQSVPESDAVRIIEQFATPQISPVYTLEGGVKTREREPMFLFSILRTANTTPRYSLRYPRRVFSESRIDALHVKRFSSTMLVRTERKKTVLKFDASGSKKTERM